MVYFLQRNCPMTTDLLQVALNDEGNLISIYDVDTGLKCGCVCPECGKELVAKNKGKKPNMILSPKQKEAHFAHHDGSDCPKAKESAIHKLAKEVLKEHKTLFLPPVENDKYELKFQFDKAEIEVKVGDKEYIIADTLLEKKSNKERVARLVVEFYKTHKKSVVDIEKIENLDVSCIEVNVNHVEPLVEGILNYRGMKRFLEDENNDRYWLHNSINITPVIDEEVNLIDENSLLDLYGKMIDEQPTYNTGMYKRFAGIIRGYGYTLVQVYSFVYNLERHYQVFCPKVNKTLQDRGERPKYKTEHLDCYDCKFYNYYTEFEDEDETYFGCGFKNKIQDHKLNIYELSLD